MAINKKFIHFNKSITFNSKKLSANSSDTQYTLGVAGAITTGTPDISYQSIVYIKDTRQIWTHGRLYNGADSPVVVLDDISDADSVGDQNYLYYDRNDCKLYGWDVSIQEYVALSPSTVCLGEVDINSKLIYDYFTEQAKGSLSSSTVSELYGIKNILDKIKSVCHGSNISGFIRVNCFNRDNAGVSVGNDGGVFYVWVSGDGEYTEQTSSSGNLVSISGILNCTTKIYLITKNNYIVRIGFNVNGSVYFAIGSSYNLLEGHAVVTTTSNGIMSSGDKVKLDNLETDVLFSYEISYNNPIRNGFISTDSFPGTDSEATNTSEYNQLVGLVKKIKEFADKGYKSFRIKLDFKDDTRSEYYYVDIPIYNTPVVIENEYVIAMPDLYFINAGGYKCKLIGNDVMFYVHGCNNGEKWWDGYDIATKAKSGLISKEDKTKLDNLFNSMEVMTQSQYNSLTTKEPNKIYFIKG